MDNSYVTSPTLKTDQGIVSSGKEFSDALTLDLTDDEIAKAFSIIALVRKKYYYRTYDTIEQGISIVEEMEKEVQTNLAEELNVLARFEVGPMLVGEPPILEILGKLPGGSMDKYGFDHEQKAWEVQRATSRNEDYLGQKEQPHANRAQRRARRKK